MGVKERRQREREQQRQRILEAALAIIANEGFAALSMRKLAERIEYSAASIYLYFKNRAQLAQELRHFGFEQLLAKLEAAVVDLTGPSALHAMGTAYLAFARKQPELYRLMFISDPGFMQLAYANMASDRTADRAYELLLGVAETVQGDSLHTAAPKEIADVIWSCLHGIVSFHLVLPGLQTTLPDVQKELSLNLLVRGLV